MEESGEIALPAGFGGAGRRRPDAARPPLDGASSTGTSRSAGSSDAGNAFRGGAPDAVAEAGGAQAREAAAFLEEAVGRWGDTVLRLAAHSATRTWRASPTIPTRTPRRAPQTGTTSWRPPSPA